MLSYNGFPPEQRNRAQAWLNQAWRSGLLVRPRVCCACGQDRGIIDAHAEDYSEPFGPHLQQFPLCYRCHMLLHCRFRNEGNWNTYRQIVADGFQLEPMFTRNWEQFKREMLAPDAPMHWPRIAQKGEPPQEKVLDQIHDGLWVPKRR